MISTCTSSAPSTTSVFSGWMQTMRRSSRAKRSASSALRAALLRQFLFTIGLLALVVAFLGAQAQRRFDLVITGGRVLDGSGNPWFAADLGIKDGHIAAVGRPGSFAADGAPRIDAGGKLVVPGFIDLHSHSDRGLATPELRS